MASWRTAPEALAWALPPPSSPQVLEARRRTLASIPDRTALALRLAEHHRRLGAPEASLAACSHLGQAGALAVVAGQQPAPGLGPLYALHKAAAAVSLAKRWGAVPVFWIAGDDHDLAEASRVRFLGATGGMEEDEAPAGPPLTPLNLLSCDGALVPWLGSWRDRLPASPHRDPLFERLSAACTGTWSDWMARSLLLLFGEDGLVVLDPSWVRDLSSGLLARYREAEPAIRHALAAHSARLKTEGYRLQAPAPEETHLFTVRDGRRERSLSGDSPDVLLRPVVQDALLPVLAMVTGPGETAYLAQTGPLYEALGVSRPPLALRPSVTLVAAKDLKHLEDWGLTPDSLLLGEQGILQALKALRPPSARAARLREAGGRWAHEIPLLAGEGMKDLEGALGASIRAVRESLESLARRVERMEEEKSGIDRRRAQALGRWALPSGKPQERTLNAWSVLCRFGEGLAGSLVDGVDWADSSPRLVVVEG